MKTKFLKIGLLTLLIHAFSSISGGQTAPDIDVRAAFTPPRLLEGDTGGYRVDLVQSIDSGQGQRALSGTPQIDQFPEVAGLRISGPHVQTGSRTEIVNRNITRTASTNLIFEVRAERAGTYQIPAWTLQFAGRSIRVPATSLEVVERGDDDPPPVSEQVFIEMNLPEKLYVGQTIATDLQLFIQRGVDVRDYRIPQRSGDGFLVSPIDQNPQGTNLLRGGEAFRVFSWPLRITPVTAGEQVFNFKMDLLTILPDARSAAEDAQRRPGGFRSPFDQFFDRRTAEWLDLETNLDPIPVLPLPREGRPESFSGAIGTFDAHSTINETTLMVGDPLTLTLEIQGEGNFDRISAPPLEGAAEWQILGSSQTFEADNVLETEGVKRFRYTLVPRQPGPLQTPELNFSFFDPQSETYRELSLGRKSVQITARPDQPASVAGEAPLPPEPVTERAPFLSPASNPGKTVLLTKESLLTPTVVSLNALSALTLLGLCLFTRHRQRLKTDTAYAIRRRARKSVKVSLSKLGNHISDLDPHSFLARAEETIRYCLSIHSGRSTEALTDKEMLALLTHAALPEELLPKIEACLAEIERRRYGGQRKPALDVELRRDWSKALRSLFQCVQTKPVKTKPSPSRSVDTR